MFDWYPKKKHLAQKPVKEPVSGFFGPHVILEDLGKRVPQYLNEVDQGELIYPACKRTLSDANGDVRSVWDHTRLEAMRYVMVPGRAPGKPLTSSHDIKADIGEALDRRRDLKT